MHKLNLRSLTSLDYRKKYLLAGLWNTIFGYSAGLFLYSLISNVLFVGILGNFLAISMSFLTYKLFVFQTAGNWISEYFKCFLVYGVSAILGTIALVILVDYMKIKFWIAQAVIIIATFFITFIAHKLFTFKR
jgi:putative flippase GtrA